jgi:myo-inositol-1(or 4)-monophosphatase
VTAPEALFSAAHKAMDMASRMMQELHPGTITEKADRDLVSDADIAIERAVRALLHELTPDVGFLGEEEGATTPQNDAELMWTLDPIDGTSNYTRGLPLCAITLALLKDQQAILGFIDAPFLNLRYHAQRNHGSFLAGTPIHVSRTQHLREAVVAIGDYASGDHAETKNRDRLDLTQQLVPRVQRLRMLGTAALDLAWLAEGKLDAAVMLSNKPWDTQAGVLIAREAGATVLDRTGEPHTISSTATIACATSTLADSLIPLVTGLNAGQQA